MNGLTAIPDKGRDMATVLSRQTPIVELERELAAKQARLHELQQSFVFVGPTLWSRSSTTGRRPRTAPERGWHR